MKRSALYGVWLAAFAACGGAMPESVDGTYAGHRSLTLVPSGAEAGAEIVTVTQTGADISFSIGTCQLKGVADSASTFRIQPFKCTRFLAAQPVQLEGNDQGKATVGISSFNVSLSGKARTGEVLSDFTWTFSGTRQ